jgi:sugar/nucleoside kinase (ribokinase family)
VRAQILKPSVVAGEMTRVVVIGDLMTDAVARAFHPLARGSDTPASVIMYGGGSGANIASWLSVEGTDTTFVGRRGSDITGRTREMELMGYGLDSRMVMDPERSTGTCVVMITHRGDRTMLSDPGANARLQPEDLPRDVFGPDGHLHVSGYTLINSDSRRAARVALRMARESGMSISVRTRRWTAREPRTSWTGHRARGCCSSTSTRPGFSPAGTTPRRRRRC